MVLAWLETNIARVTQNVQSHTPCNSLLVEARSMALHESYILHEGYILHESYIVSYIVYLQDQS